jgi:hypothetical protein
MIYESRRICYLLLCMCNVSETKRMSWIDYWFVLTESLADPPTNWLIDWLFHSFTYSPNTLADPPTNWLIDWLSHSVTFLPTHSSTHWLVLHFTQSLNKSINPRESLDRIIKSLINHLVTKQITRTSRKLSISAQNRHMLDILSWHPALKVFSISHVETKLLHFGMSSGRTGDMN